MNKNDGRKKQQSAQTAYQAAPTVPDQIRGQWLPNGATSPKQKWFARAMLIAFVLALVVGIVSMIIRAL